MTFFKKVDHRTIDPDKWCTFKVPQLSLISEDPSKGYWLTDYMNICQVNDGTQEDVLLLRGTPCRFDSDTEEIILDDRCELIFQFTTYSLGTQCFCPSESDSGDYYHRLVLLNVPFMKKMILSLIDKFTNMGTSVQTSSS